MKRSDEAEKLYREGLQTNSTSNNLHYFYAQLLEESLHRPEEAEQEYRKTLERVSSVEDRPRVLIRLGLLLSRLNRKAEARQVYNEIYTLNPNNAVILNSL